VRLLELAATEGEERVAEALREVVARGESLTLERIAGMLTGGEALPINTTSYGVRVAPVVLTLYDSLLRHAGQEVCS